MRADYHERAWIFYYRFSHNRSNVTENKQANTSHRTYSVGCASECPSSCALHLECSNITTERLLAATSVFSIVNTVPSKNSAFPRYETHRYNISPLFTRQKNLNCFVILFFKSNYITNARYHLLMLVF